MVSIGIDVSKGKSAVCFLKLHGEVLHKPFEIEHTESSLPHLINLISLIQEDVRVVMEAICAKIFLVRIKQIFCF